LSRALSRERPGPSENQAISGEDRCVTTLITAAKETNNEADKVALNVDSSGEL